MKESNLILQSSHVLYQCKFIKYFIIKYIMKLHICAFILLLIFYMYLQDIFVQIIMFGILIRGFKGI